MYVPNYVPEPLEVPGNVTLAPYLSRVLFIRRVTFSHFASLLVTAGLGFIPWPKVGWVPPLAALSAVLIGLDLLRIRYRGRGLEADISTLFLPFILVLLAWAGRELFLMKVPVWSAVLGVGGSAVYSIVAGRDYSFVGGYLLALILSSLALAALAIQAQFGGREAAAALLFNAGYLFYFAYDLASLMARRREDEVFAGVVDLYRDVFNFFGYFVRVLRHWKKHRIWVQPR
jgi:hypothetical protein